MQAICVNMVMENLPSYILSSTERIKHEKKIGPPLPIFINNKKCPKIFDNPFYYKKIALLRKTIEFAMAHVDMHLCRLHAFLVIVI